MHRITPIPIGVEFYKQMVSEGYYYIDKTLLIRDLLENKNTVTLFTRPRRFGKTLAQTMIKTFFEKEILPDGTVEDNSVYFQGKKIMEAGEEYLKHMGQYPVIFMSLKPAKQPTYEMAYGNIIEEIWKEFHRHRYVLESDVITEEYKEIYSSVLKKKADSVTYARAVQFLSECLSIYHNQKRQQGSNYVKKQYLSLNFSRNTIGVQFRAANFKGSRRFGSSAGFCKFS